MLNNKKILYTLLALSLTMNAFMAWICFSDKETDIAGRTYQTAVLSRILVSMGNILYLKTTAQAVSGTNSSTRKQRIAH